MTYLASLALLLSVLCIPFPCAGDVVVVSNPSVPLDSLSRNFARSIFGMRVQQWPGDGGVKVFVLPDNHALHDTFSKTVLDVFPHQLRSSWDRQIYSGTGQAPVEVESEEEMLSKIASTPGAVGYLNRDMVDEKKVRPLRIH
jgi:ABC-type phosphate transport system substrate-binding protein